ncbi:TetR family transcriptional regulator [Microbacterium sp. NPDC056234]|uniref:TetR family transcriptional regulator n=1 Tax=Microbacterium sp. NPDC056234 TaxID=3345757 RepID=UPI0035D99BBC
MMAERNSDRSGRHDRDSVTTTALRLLDDVGLPDLSMRRLATELGIQPSALYWHFDSKQQLLGAIAERILSRIPLEEHDEIATDADVLSAARSIRDALLAYRDGAEVVLSSYALGFGVDRTQARLRSVLQRRASIGADVAATTLLQFVIGHALLVQQRLHAESLGATHLVGDDTTGDVSSVFDDGVMLFLHGIDAAAKRPEDHSEV